MSDLTPKLNPEQQQAVDQHTGGVLVLAPVGTGKTTVIAERTARLIQGGMAPNRVLCLSFTNKAAREMRARIAMVLGPQASAVQVRTFHGLCAHILRYEAKLLGIASDFVIYDEEDAEEIVRQLAPRYGVTWRGNEGEKIGHALWDVVQAAKQAAAMQTTIDLGAVLRRRLVDDQLDRVVSFHPGDLAALVTAYEQQLAHSHALDFTDLLTLATRLFREHPAALQRWQLSFDAVQVDEVQDTSVTEYDIIAQLARHHRNLAFFGDTDQTIFEWRDSQPQEILRRFRKAFGPIREIHLTRNYRSTRPIVDACRAVIQACPGAVTTTLEAMSAHPGEPLRLHSAATAQHEAEWIATEIRALQGRGVPYRDIAILTRTNYTATAISEQLEQHEVPHVMVEQFKFFRRAEIKDALAYLRLTLNRADASSLRRVLATPPRGIGEATIAALRDVPPEVGFQLIDCVRPLADALSEPFEPLLQHLRDGTLVIFDVETTGLNTAIDEIIELAALKIDATGRTTPFHRYVCPSHTVGDSEHIHGISDAVLTREGVPPRQAFTEFSAFIDGCLLVGHNVAFDRTILRSHLRRVGLNPEVVGPTEDTLDLTRRFFHLRQYNLGAVCAALGITATPTHRAMDDVRATHELLQRIVPCLEAGCAERRQLTARYLPPFQPLAAQLQRWGERSEHERPADVLAMVVEESGLLQHWYTKPEGARRVTNLRELHSLFQHYDDPRLAPPDALVHVLSITALGADADRIVHGDDRVTLLTVHAAKGSEFPVVFLAGVDDGMFPFYRAAREGRTDEEHRLFYVALTRAKERVYLTHHWQRGKWVQQRSRYVSLIPPPLMSEV